MRKSATDRYTLIFCASCQKAMPTHTLLSCPTSCKRALLTDTLLTLCQSPFTNRQSPELQYIMQHITTMQSVAFLFMYIFSCTSKAISHVTICAQAYSVHTHTFIKSMTFVRVKDQNEVIKVGHPPSDTTKSIAGSLAILSKSCASCKNKFYASKKENKRH